MLRKTRYVILKRDDLYNMLNIAEEAEKRIDKGNLDEAQLFLITLQKLIKHIDRTS